MEIRFESQKATYITNKLEIKKVWERVRNGTQRLLQNKS